MADTEYRQGDAGGDVTDATTRRRGDDRNPENRDPITGAPGAHPVGTGVGAAVGGAAAGAGTGMAIGAVGGPIGMGVGAAIGTAVGAVVGGLAGKGIAEKINPTEEHAYWRSEYATRPYADRNYPYEDYGPAYQYGWESREQYRDRQFNEVESDLSRGWDKAKGKSRLEWEKAKSAVRDSWDRVAHRRSAASAGNVGSTHVTGSTPSNRNYPPNP